MGRQNKDQAIVGSSIVLLQERFKQLQRLKEMREETQMLRLMPQEADRHDLPNTRFSTSPNQDPLALGLNSASQHHRHAPHFRGIDLQQFSGVRGPHNFFETQDVDTSLRL